MSSTLIIMLEFGVTIGGIVGFGVWELWSLKRARREDAAKAREGP